MIEELIKRLKDKNLSEQEEQKLNIELAKAQELLIQNQNERSIKELRLQKIKKDEEKTEKLNDIDAKIIEKKEELKRLQKIGDSTSIITSLLILAGTIAVSSAAIKFANSFILWLFSSFASVLIGLGIITPFAVIHGKNTNQIEEEIRNLETEKSKLIEEINIDNEICMAKDSDKHVKNVIKKSNIKNAENFENEHVNSI